MADPRAKRKGALVPREKAPTIDARYLVNGVSRHDLSSGSTPVAWAAVTGKPSVNTTAPLTGGGSLASSLTLTTSMATNKLIGRYSAGTGVMQEVTIGSGLSLSGGGTLTATSSGDVTGPASSVADRIAVFNGTTGKIIKDGGKVITDLVATSALDTDGTLAANSDAKVATQKATKTYVGAYSQPLSTYLTALSGASQSITADTTLTTQRAVLNVNGSWAITLPAISTWTLNVPTLVEYHGTTAATITIIPDAADKIEGATRAALYGEDIIAAFVPVEANKIILLVYVGVGMWLHDGTDTTAASGAGPWTLTSINGVSQTWTDTSSATNSVAASSGFVLTSGTINQAYFGSSLGAAISTPLSGFLDAWGRSITPEDEFWLLCKEVKSVTVASSTPGTSIVLSGSAISATPKIGATNNQSGGTGLSLYASLRVTTTSSTPFPSEPYLTASHWMGFRYLGSENRTDDYMLSASPSGNPGAASGWWPTAYSAVEHFAGLGDAYTGEAWNHTTLNYVRYVQTINATLGSKFRLDHVDIIRVRRGSAC